MHQIFTRFPKYILIFILCCCGNIALAQTDTLQPASIETTITAKGVQFTPHLPELQGIPGGRAPYYTYFWDFGDGHFSRASQPVHVYAQPGDYRVKLYATNNYDKGDKPPRPVKHINVQYASKKPSISIDERMFLSDEQIFKLGKNTNAMPGTDIVLIAGVKPVSKHGEIYILSNEKIYGAPGFAYDAQTRYNKEKILKITTETTPFYASAKVKSATITRSGSPNYGEPKHKVFSQGESVEFFKTLYNSYQSVTSYKITGTKEQEQFSYIHINILPEMIRDTNAIVTLTGIYFPDNSTKAYIHRLDIPVVTSHDPNRMSVKQTRLNYRTTFKGKRLTYKVQFQNNGKGDAKNVRLEMVLPEVMDRSSFKLLNIYPHISPCTDSTDTACWRKKAVGKDSLIFYFKGISLPGSKAENKVPYDSTQGFIRFSIKADKRLPNKAFKGRTAIYFDKNEPVITNWATGRFKKSLSPIVFLGYNFITSSEAQKVFEYQGRAQSIPFEFKNNFEVGVGIAPLAPYKKLFWQAELRVGYYEQTAALLGMKTQREVKIDGKMYVYNKYDEIYNQKNLRLRLAFLPLKYNLNSWVSFGAGVEGNITFNVNSEKEQVFYTLNNGAKTLINESEISDTPIHWRPFVDLNIGRVYLGPSLGVRYYIGVNDFSSLSAYVAWRF